MSVKLLPGAGDRIGGYVVVEVIEDYWAPGQHALIVEDAASWKLGKLDEEREWVPKES